MQDNNQSQPQRPRDPMVLFRSVKRGKNSKGGDRTELMMNKEQATLLINELTKNIDSPNGVKLDFHISVKEYEGRKFDSAICFVKPVQDRPGAAPRTFVPQAGAPSADTMARAEKFKNELVG